MSRDTKISSPSRSTGGIQKRVVSVPIKDVQRLRLKGHDHQISAPPSDSWAWRKYGQKPIKGSPYPRGYYKCSSSKGCPARKQVERSKLDPNMLVVTYSCEHNHPWPPDLRNNYKHHHRKPAAAAAVANITTSLSEESEEEEEEEEEEEDEEEDKKALDLNNSCQSRELISEDDFFSNNVGEWPLINYGGDQFGLFSDFESLSSFTAILECPILADDRDRITVTTDNEMAMIFTTMIEEDDSLIFSDLGELPECATVFRRV